MGEIFILVAADLNTLVQNSPRDQAKIKVMQYYRGEANNIVTNTTKIMGETTLKMISITRLMRNMR